MSHNVDGPPIAPFAARSVYVDKDSTSAVIDGSYAHPYKTIQAALDVMPAPGSAEEAAEAWLILVEAGVYEEALIIPASGFVHIKGTGLVSIGTTAAPKTLGRTAVVGGFSETNLLKMENIQVSGVMTLIAGGGVRNNVTLINCNIKDFLDGSAVSAGFSRLIMQDTRTVDLNFNGVVVATDSSVGVGVCITLQADRSSFYSLAVSDRLTRLTFCTVDTTASTLHFDALVSTVFWGAFVSTGTSGDVDHCDFQDNVATFATGLGNVTHTKFPQGVTVAAAGGNFINCKIGGNFTGPASSYRADGATVEKSTPTLAGGATYVPLNNVLHTAIIATTANIVGGAANFRHIDITGILGNRIVIVGVYIKRLTGGSVEAAIEVFDNDVASNAQPIFGVGTSGNGYTVGATFARGPRFATGGVDFYVAMPYEDVDATNEIHMRVYNTDAAGSPGSDGSFEVRVSYYKDTINLA